MFPISELHSLTDLGTITHAILTKFLNNELRLTFVNYSHNITFTDFFYSFPSPFLF